MGSENNCKYKLKNKYNNSYSLWSQLVVRGVPDFSFFLFVCDLVNNNNKSIEENNLKKIQMQIVNDSLLYVCVRIQL